MGHGGLGASWGELEGLWGPWETQGSWDPWGLGGPGKSCETMGNLCEYRGLWGVLGDLEGPGGF